MKYRKINLGIFQFLCLMSLGITYGNPHNEIDSLKATLAKKQADTSLIKTLNNLGRSFILIGSNDSARKYLSLSLKKAAQIHSFFGQIDCLNQLGIICEYESKFPEALEWYSKALKISRLNKDEMGEATTISYMGIIYEALGENEKATSLYLKACQFFEKLGDKLRVANVEVSLGSIFHNKKDYTKALEYYFHALKIYENTHDKMVMSILFGNIAIIYNDQKLFDKGLFYGLKSLELTKATDDKQGQAGALLGIGSSFEGKGEFKKALPYYLEGVALYKILGNQFRISEAYKIIAMLYERLGKHKMAYFYFNQQLMVAKKIPAKKSLLAAYFSLSQHFGLMKDYGNAYKFNKLYSDLNDSLFVEENMLAIAESEAKYQNDKKKKEIALLEKDGEIKALTIIKNKGQIIGLILGMVVLILLAFFIYQRVKWRARQRLDAEILRQQDLGLLAILEGQESERQRIAKDLHDGVGQQLVGLKLSVLDAFTSQKGFGVLPTEKSNLINRILDEVATEVRSISHQMMPGALVEAGLVPALEDMLHKSLSSSTLNYQFEHAKVNERFAKNIETNLYRISQELVQNIYKHAQATEVNFQLFKVLNRLVLVVEDNGIGIGQNEKAMKGMGLLNISARVKAMKGELSIEPGPFSGTVTTIRIPIA